MNILVLNGSPRKNGNTSRLVSAFQKGAEESGHTVTVEMVAFQEIHGCKACEYCHTKENGKCVQKDDMQAIYPKILAADMMVLASPIYYYTITGQLQCALHRTYAFGRLSNIKKAVLILSSGASGVYNPAIEQYKGVISWWGTKDEGIFTVPGIERSHSADNTKKERLEELYRFGKNLR